MTPLLTKVDYGQGVEDAWSEIASFVPRLAAFLLILLVGYFIIKVLAKAVDKALERVGFDRAVERGGVARAMSKSQYDPSDLVSKILFYTLFLFLLRFAFGVFGQNNAVSQLLDSVIAYLPKLIVAIVIVVLASAIAAAVREIVTASLGGLSYGKMLANAVAVVILAIGGFAALSQLNIAPAIVNGLFYGIVGTVAGILVISIGAGGIKPMQSRWERVLSKVDQESANVKQEAQGAGQRVADRAENLRGQARNS